MVSGSGSGGVGRIGGGGVDRLIRRAVELGVSDDAVIRQRLIELYSEDRIRAWTNDRVRAALKAGETPGPAASIGKVHQGSLNQRVQLLATDLLGPAATAWEISPGDGGDGGGDAVGRTGAETWAETLPFEVSGMLRSRGNTIEGGTTEVNKNVIGEKVLGLPREPDPWHGIPWAEVPRS